MVAADRYRREMIDRKLKGIPKDAGFENAVVNVLVDLLVEA